jgi:pectate lyase
MKNMKSTVALVILLMAILTSIIGCGGGGGKSPGGSPGNTPDFSLIGFAAMGSGTIGGQGGTVHYVATGKELQDAIFLAKTKDGGKPQIIYVNGTITLANSAENADNKKINIKEVSNVSIIGIGAKGELDGIGFKIWKSSNIIIRNLKIHHVVKALTDEGDAIGIDGPSDHIWVDHCELYSDRDHDKEYYDGLFEVKDNSEYITFSWNYIHDHWKTSLIGYTTSDTYDRKITYHHNYFENCNSRMPSYRGGTGHIFNNYYNNIIETGINSRLSATLRIENNYFENSKNPIGNWDDPLGYWDVRNNMFVNCIGDQPTTSTGTFNPPYSYLVDPVESVKSIVMQWAGVSKIDITDPGTATPSPPAGTSPSPSPSASPVAFIPLIETFDRVVNGTNIKNDNSKLDNPNRFPTNLMSGSITAGTTTSGSGAITLESQRMAFNVTGLSGATNPLLKVRIKNDDGSGIPVPNLKLAVGSDFSTDGSILKAHGEYAVTNSAYDVMSIPLNTSFISTNRIQFRGLVGSNGTAGLHIDKIEVVEQ